MALAVHRIADTGLGNSGWLVDLGDGSALVVDPARDPREPLARAAWRSITGTLLQLPDGVPVYPTHGGGSFCSAGSADQSSTTIGEQRRSHPLLQAGDEDSFATWLGWLVDDPDTLLLFVVDDDQDTDDLVPAGVDVEPSVAGWTSRVIWPAMPETRAVGPSMGAVRAVPRRSVAAVG